MDIHSLPDVHLRTFDRPEVRDPSEIRDIYLIAICGTGMGSLAGLLRQAGHSVRGSDQHVYPPMSLRLAAEGIPVHQGYDPQHLDPPPDLVIVGNACTPTHVEAVYAREHGLVQQSFPEALAHFFLKKRRSLVVAGTHGKTTTTGLLVHLLQSVGKDPGFLVGGVMQESQTSYNAGSGPHFVVEGDEYDSAYFDKRPKFMHYRPHSAIVTSMELDHTDIYPDWPAYQGAFEDFAGQLPSDGTLVLCGDHEEVLALARHTKARVVTYGLDSEINRISAASVTALPRGQNFTLIEDGREVAELFLPIHGSHNLSNALGAIALAISEGIEATEFAEGLARYRGMRRRQEVRGEVDGVMVIDDFAHHPTAVRETLGAIRQAYPGRPVVAVFEPRSNASRRKDFQDAYVAAFVSADRAFLSNPPFRHNDRPENFMDAGQLVADLEERGVSAATYADADELLPHLAAAAKPGDVVLVMSNGGFGGLHEKLLARLASGVRESGSLESGSPSRF